MLRRSNRQETSASKVTPKNQLRSLTASALALLLYLSQSSQPAQAQSQPVHAQPGSSELDSLDMETNATGPRRFVASHGRYAVIQGYASEGLDMFAWPLQVIGNYEVSFRKDGETTEARGSEILQKLTYGTSSITRTYIGTDYVVRETLFAPLKQPAAFVSYAVDSKTPVHIVVRFKPVLDLMWPGAIGAQNTGFDEASHTYVLTEPRHRFSAFIGSPQMLTHDEPINLAQSEETTKPFAFSMKAGGSGAERTATVVMGKLEKADSDVAATTKELLANKAKWESDAKFHTRDLFSKTLRITTPDKSVNQILARAELALDQSFVCNPYLGCGCLAGYGPSRPGRRPQYEWFFVGDGLVAVSGMLAAGQYERAREELQFILSYQDKKSGMIWHELSQSATLVDWEKNYPFMFVHVDITFAFLEALERYATTTGDATFIQDHWDDIKAAFTYCRTILSSEDGLPRIPSTKEGANEQDRLTDDLGLGVQWLAACDAYARMAEMSDRKAEGKEAIDLAKKARASILKRYWLAGEKSWIDGYNSAGPVKQNRADVLCMVDKHLLQPAEIDSVLRKIASADYQTDWGTRGLAASSPKYEPSWYSQGSVTAPRTAEAAATYWNEHRPATASNIWSSLLPWNTLDSLGHMHEVLAGDFFRPQMESVPEQTWSSADFFASFVSGLLGLKMNGITREVEFAPHLPPKWDSLQLKNVRCGDGRFDLSLTRTKQGLDLVVENRGDPFNLRFAPQIPLGAKLAGASVNGKHVATGTEGFAEDAHAALQIKLTKGTNHCQLQYHGGVLVSIPAPAPSPGESSHGAKLTSLNLDGSKLAINLDADLSRQNSIFVHTSERITNVEGATTSQKADDIYELTLPPSVNQSQPAYRHVEITLTLSKKTAQAPSGAKKKNHKPG